jgi:hypothetical protein
VLWNCSSKTAICQNPWASAKNYNIGYKGTYVDDKTFGNRPRGEWDGANVPGLNPQSLYFAQKLDRNLTLDFGLLESTGYFINDSIFQLKFNQAFDTLTVLNTENYSVSGNSGIVGSPSKVTIIDSISLNLQFTGYGILQYNSQLIILDPKSACKVRRLVMQTISLFWHKPISRVISISSLLLKHQRRWLKWMNW